MGVADNIEAVRAFYAAGPADDDGRRARYASPDIVWHVPGDNPVAGEYRGYDEVFGAIGARMRPLDEWDIELVDLAANLDLVVSRVHLVGRRGPHAVDCPGGHVFRLDDRARIVEVWGLVRDQEALDELFRWTDTA
jgi:limonene-1,2-epoxide hydrolase